MADIPALSAGISRARAIRQMAAALEKAGVEAPLREARLLFLAATGLSHSSLIANDQEPVKADQISRLNNFVQQRCNRVPFARIVGRQEFYGLDFELSPTTLIPRADTETLVDAVLAEAAHRGLKTPTILDLGTGTGAILAALLHILPHATGLGIDAAPEAVETARSNLARIAPGRADIRQGHWFEGITDRFDIIVSNPPYIPSVDVPHLAPEVAKGEPRLALDGGTDGLDCYRSIAVNVGAHMTMAGFLAVEIGTGQQGDVVQIFGHRKLGLIGSKADLGGHPRAVIFAKNATLSLPK